MATATRVLFSLLAFSISFFNIIPSNNAHSLSTCNFDAIYQLGDSIADTGNYIQLFPFSEFSRPPYGQTLNKATGRCSDGKLIIDYLAESAGIPLLDAYLNKNGSFDLGVNFAVASATALPDKEVRRTNILSRQLGWMSTYFDGICLSDVKDCLKKNERALFLVGEIGGNDYNFALWRGKTLEEVKAMVPNVVQAIKDAVKSVIGYGATRIIVPGNFPIGCFPFYLSGFAVNDTSAYDELDCLKYLNNFSIYHNDHLQQAIVELKEEYPNVIIVYANYYNAFLWLFSKANMLGLDPKSLQKACCGYGGEYNFDFSRSCGHPQATVCSNPSERVSWDGIHLTQRAYESIAGWLIRDIYPKLQCEQIDSYSSAV
ncbi:Lipase, GDSL [Corchorus olitorius]|uniref:Lipase, GDSL n=1 Tax=Corchorus olitorius TaxID=93759 RepID=A0A1R3ITS4_9ROSI|nr:Lipase, GDSL [Corchorus olitorius]